MESVVTRIVGYRGQPAAIYVPDIGSKTTFVLLKSV